MCAVQCEHCLCKSKFGKALVINCKQKFVIKHRKNYFDSEYLLNENGRRSIPNLPIMFTKQRRFCEYLANISRFDDRFDFDKTFLVPGKR